MVWRLARECSKRMKPLRRRRWLWRSVGSTCAGALLVLVVGCAQSSSAPPTAPPVPGATATAGSAPSVSSVATRPATAPSPTVALTARPTATPPAAQTPAASNASSSSPSPEPAPTSYSAGTQSVTATPGAQLAPGGVVPEPPERDLFELAQRLGPVSDEPISRVVSSGPTSYEEGHQDTFFVTDLIDGSVHTIQATLKVVSQHAYWYVDDAVALPVDALREAAAAYEGNIHPAVSRSFGEIWNPGVDNDPRLTILHTPLRQLVGYFSSRDEYPRQIIPESNQREIIYVDGEQVRPGTPVYLGVLTHELQHAVHWNLDPGEDAWVTEGMSELAKDLAGYGASFIDFFLDNPATQLNFWPNEVGSSAPHYGAATLFLMYLAQHYGGHEGLRLLGPGELGRRTRCRGIPITVREELYRCLQGLGCRQLPRCPRWTLWLWRPLGPRARQKIHIWVRSTYGGFASVRLPIHRATSGER